jgi:hypothetical protein
MIIDTVSAMVAGPVPAFGAPSLPPTAKKLSGKEIVILYDGFTFKFKDFLSDVPNTGTVTFDFKNRVTSGTLDGYGHTLGSIKLDGDKLCNQGGGFNTCSNVYVDGTDIYEVNSEGIVVSTLQKQ